MSKSSGGVDILVLGNHPAAFVAAAVLAHKSGLRIVHALLPEGEPLDQPDKLVQIHPGLFSLHPLLSPLKRKIKVTGIYGARFLSEDSVSSEYRSKSAMCGIGSYNEVRAAMEKLATAQGVAALRPQKIDIPRADERGVDVVLEQQAIHPAAIVLADPLPPKPAEPHRVLGLPEEWEQGVVRRCSRARLSLDKAVESTGRPIIPMTLNLQDTYGWGWMLPGEDFVELCIEQPLESVAAHRPAELMKVWAQTLVRHGALKEAVEIDEAAIKSRDLPLAGALAHEGVANRTLLVGPAGGFYAATGEDIYPNCWSTIFAAEVLKKALKQPFLQDALQPYRHVWRTTLGDYLRGPQQNLRFLLPLIYRNQIMTTRMVEGILTGKK